MIAKAWRVVARCVPPDARDGKVEWRTSIVISDTPAGALADWSTEHDASEVESWEVAPADHEVIIRTQ